MLISRSFFNFLETGVEIAKPGELPDRYGVWTGRGGVTAIIKFSSID